MICKPYILCGTGELARLVKCKVCDYEHPSSAALSPGKVAFIYSATSGRQRGESYQLTGQLVSSGSLKKIRWEPLTTPTFLFDKNPTECDACPKVYLLKSSVTIHPGNTYEACMLAIFFCVFILLLGCPGGYDSFDSSGIASWRAPSYSLWFVLSMCCCQCRGITTSCHNAVCGRCRVPCKPQQVQ